MAAFGRGPAVPRRRPRRVRVLGLCEEVARAPHHEERRAAGRIYKVFRERRTELRRRHRDERGWRGRASVRHPRAKLGHQVLVARSIVAIAQHGEVAALSRCGTDQCDARTRIELRARLLPDGPMREGPAWLVTLARDCSGTRLSPHTRVGFLRGAVKDSECVFGSRATTPCAAKHAPRSGCASICAHRRWSPRRGFRPAASRSARCS